MSHRDYCRRCEREVEVDRPSAAWKIMRWIWYAGVVALMLVTPAIAAEVTFLTPLAIFFLGGGALIIDQAKAPPRCKRCSLALKRPKSA